MHPNVGDSVLILCRQKQNHRKQTLQGRGEVPLGGSSVPPAFSIASPHRGRTPTGVGSERLGVRANSKAA